MSSEPVFPLFSYGTLQQASVQTALFGRLLTGRPDALVGFRLSTLRIRDPEAIGISGMVEHLVLVPTAGLTDEIAGVAFELTSAELAAADRYEGAEYRRVEVRLRTGARAWVYIGA